MALLLFSSVMLKFNRLAQMSKEAEVIAGAVAKSTSGLLEVRDVASLSCIACNYPFPQSCARSCQDVDIP